MWNYKKCCVFWRRGGNWAAFFLLWFFASAIISALEHSEQNKELNLEEESKRDVDWIIGFFKAKVEHFKNNTKVTNQLEQIINLMDESPDMPRLWRETGFEVVWNKPQIIKTYVEFVKEEFLRIKEDLDKDDITGRELADTTIKLLAEDDTTSVFTKYGEDHMKKVVEERKKKEKKCLEKRKEGQPCEERWSFGHSLHFTSTVFTTTGYGGATPITAGGELATIFLIIIQIPFFLHCLATTAAHINRMLDIFLGISSKHDDLEDLTTETANSRQRQLVMLKGLLVLASVLLIHMVVAAVYHFCTTGWSFSDVLYFEFVRTASVGFGDIIPEDEFTLAGAILKNLLINIPGQIVTFAMFVRVLPLIS
eukprot:GFUD01113169.1.p1 GENE.GFUD01113169.1~~GFUD01113169.1.p1  ORF type:complete len:366 (+),score=101.15 GFUD01113169.1:28-1125(+)